MDNSATRKQEIYDKIKESSKHEFILSEMKRLGFWGDDKVNFEKVNAFLKEENALSGDLSKLVKKERLIKDTDAFIANKHKERKKLSKEKQKETKLKREQIRKEKAEKWQQTKKEDITYLGAGYSHQLNDTQIDEVRLKEAGLPIYHSVKDLAQAMKITVNELRFLAFSRKNSQIEHYKRFKVAKKSGGYRLISAPMPRLKRAQHFILENILNKVIVHDKAHGCVKERSIVSNAAPHVDKAVVINQDLKNFFPSVTYKRIKGVFKSLGYSEQLAVIFSLLCSESKILDISLLGENYFSQRGERFLPQGSPCSPAITNILCRKMDFRLDGLAMKYGFAYSRYVDDTTFSGNQEQFKHITAILKYSKKIISEENFNLHPDKLKIMKRNQRQEVTGIVVNEKLNINKKSLKRFRALLYQIEKEGIAGKTWNGGLNVLAEIDGYANYIYQVDKEKGVKYKSQVGDILKAHSYKESHQEKYVKNTNDIQGNDVSELTSKVESKEDLGILKKISSLFKK
ncbi:RNA-directed DNA polymerase [Tenacibaculum finnmarkense]|uniref:reverse transcriptase family protein n=1 Tax=Tenacibaculum finnmarkense TaxID=2781243 RepID=UPI001EFA2B1A|nr:reverse transcriptase family protein [Tenacibaculum finnmarkense]MCG8807645.1 RNA-directed DNA polymerase [Tenacibaculum finnmarkense]MCG8817864.1 RNA-directed DNA polymerase [Tenacibaculum finnmarkense]